MCRLLDVLRAVTAYERTFEECCKFPFREARLYNVPSDMEYANFISGVKPTVYHRYIRLARLCIIHPSLLDLIIEFNNRDCVCRNKSTKNISLSNLTD